MLVSVEPGQAVLDGPGPDAADALHVVEVVDRGPHDLLQAAETVDDVADDAFRQPGHLGQQAEATGLQAVVELGAAAGEVQCGGHGAEVEQLVGGQHGQRRQRVGDRPRAVAEVVLDDEEAVVLHVADQLVELQADQPGVGAELDDVVVDLVGDAAHHLAALEHRRRRRATVTRSSTSSAGQRRRTSSRRLL